MRKRRCQKNLTYQGMDWKSQRVSRTSEHKRRWQGWKLSQEEYDLNIQPDALEKKCETLQQEHDLISNILLINITLIAF